MNTRSITKMLGVAVISLAAGAYATGVWAESYPLDSKLEQCEAEFAKAHSGNISQAEAAKARNLHLDLVEEILVELNKRNSSVSTDTGEVLSQHEILNNLRVMGHLMEMMAAEHRGATLEWSYTD